MLTLKSPLSGQQLMHSIMYTLNFTIEQTLDPGLLEEQISDRWITFYLLPFLGHVVISLDAGVV